MSDQFDREQEYLEEQLSSGEMSNGEYNKEMRALERDFRDAAEESAQQAYDDEMGRW